MTVFGARDRRAQVGEGETPSRRTTWREYLRALGPGLITGASDDDPSGIATYAQAGAQYGPSLLWVSLVTYPLMCAVQEICDRTALATGLQLGELVTKRFTRWGRFVVLIMLVVLVIANTLNIAADLVAVGSGMTLLHLGATWLWALISGIAITVVISSGSFHQVSRILKLLCVSLLAFVVVAVVVTHHWGAILIDTVVPHLRFDSSYVTILIAILGTTISPYLLFWQSANRLEEMREEPEGGDEPLSLARRSRARATKKQRMSRIDVFGGMALSNVVMFAIIAATAATLHVHHQTKILSAAQAAQSLRPLAGPFSSGLFALGFIGSGMLAIPVLAASGSSATSGLLGREWGFSRSIREAPMFYSLVALGTLGGTALSFVHINPIRLLVFVAIINGVIAAPLLAVVMIIAGNRRIMGDYLNGRIAKILGWATVAIMGAASVDLFASGGLGW